MFVVDWRVKFLLLDSSAFFAFTVIGCFTGIVICDVTTSNAVDERFCGVSCGSRCGKLLLIRSDSKPLSCT